MALLGGLLLLAAIALLSTLPARAAKAAGSTIPNAITSVSLAPNPVAIGGQLTTRITWQVPNGTQAGSTFSLTLDPKLRDLPSSFDLKDAGGNVVANAVVSTATPAVLTITMTDYAARHVDVSGTAFVISNFSASTGNDEFVFSTPNGTTFRSVVTVTGSPTVDRVHGNKFGTWLRADQGRSNPTDFLQWSVGTPAGPFNSASITDTPPAPQSIDCATVIVQLGDDTGPQGSFAHAAPYPAAVVNCSSSALTVHVGVATARQVFKVRFAVSIPSATSQEPPQTFSNTAGEAIVTQAGTLNVHPSASIVQASGGGNGQGVSTTPGVSIRKDDSAGHAADSPAAAVTLPDGKTGLVFTIVNSGTEPLDSVVVTDTVVANGTVTGLSCVFPDRSTGTTWAGPFAPAATFTCTAQLTGVATGTPLHHDIGTVTARGIDSGVAVTASNAYFATTVASAIDAPSPSPTPTSSHAPATPSAPSSSTAAPSLASTGVGMLPLALGLALAAIGTLLVLAGRPNKDS